MWHSLLLTSGGEPLPPSIMIIAPHSHCESKEYRDCDSVAGQAIKALRAADRQKLIAREHLADRLRAEGDYNRPITDADKWREDARAIASATRPSFVLEVHSFPGDHTTFREAWPGADLVLFESPANAAWIGRLADDVRKRAPGLKIMTAAPWHPCAITDDMAKLGLRHTLVEFNEDMPRERIGPLAEALLESLAQMLAESPAERARGGSIAGWQKSKWLVALLIALVVMFVMHMVWCPVSRPIAQLTSQTLA